MSTVSLPAERAAGAPPATIPTPRRPDVERERVPDADRAASDRVAQSIAADERLDVAPLLAAYNGALQLARRPPASLALPRPLERVHRALRPRLGCHYFATRHVLRRTAVLERALAARTAMDRVDERDCEALAAVRSFRASLTPSPPRAGMLAGLIAAVLVSQALIGWMLDLASDDETDGKPSRLGETVDNLSLSLDVKSIGDVIRALVSASFIELGVVVMSVVAVVYLFGRPLGCGFRLAQLCLNRRPRLSRRRRRSPLCAQAAGFGVAAHEAALTTAHDVDFRRDVPIDLMVKASVWFAMGYVLVGFARAGVLPSIAATRVVVWLAASAAVLASLSWLVRHAKVLRARGMRPVRLLLGAASLGLVAWLTLGPFEFADAFRYVWLAFLALILTRLTCLARRAPTCPVSQRLLCFGLPLVLIAAIGVAVRYAPDASESALRGYAIAHAALNELPEVPRADLQMLLASRHDLSRADLRVQDLHDLSLRAKDLSGAQLVLANLDRADLGGARLRRANLRAVSAADATLRGADLRGADLGCANLAGADLRHARLANVRWDGAVADASTRWPAGFDRRGRGITSPERQADSGYSSDYSFYGYLAYSCRFE